MSSPLRSPLTAVLLLGGAAVALVGGVLFVSSRTTSGVLTFIVGFAIMFGGALAHDAGHRRRGELPHAMWGANDRNRPSWLTKGEP